MSKENNPVIPPFEQFLDAIRNGDKRIVQKLILSSWTSGKSFNIRNTNKNGESALHIATQGGQLEILELLLKEYFYIDLNDNNGDTPLIVATRNCNAKSQLEIIELLLKHKARIFCINKEGIGPAQLAIQNKSIKIVKLFIDAEIKLNESYTARNTMLNLAVKDGLTDIAELLLKSGANANQDFGSFDKSPLHVAITKNYTKIVDLLVKYQAELTTQDKDGNTPLHMAINLNKALIVNINNISIVQILLKGGADLYLQNKAGDTPLHMALKSKQLQIAQMMLMRDVKLDLQNKDGDTALHIALKFGMKDIAQMMLMRDVNLNLQNKDGDTALHIACKSGMKDIAQMMLTNNVNLNLQNKAGDTALHIACKSGMKDIAQMMLTNNVKLDLQNKDGDTALHIVCKSGMTEVVQMMLMRDVNLNLQNKDGNTALHIATDKGNPDLVKALLENGANPNINNYRLGGSAPLHNAIENRCITSPYYVTEQYLKNLDIIIKNLLEKGADLLQQDKFNNSPLYIAYRDNERVLMKLLLHNSDYLKQPIYAHFTLLHLAIADGGIKIIEFLLKEAADINFQDALGNTALHYAATAGKESILNYLFEKNANLNQVNKNLETPLYSALINNKEKCINVLISNKAKISKLDLMKLYKLNPENKIYESLLKEITHTNQSDITNEALLNKAIINITGEMLPELITLNSNTLNSLIQNITDKFKAFWGPTDNAKFAKLELTPADQSNIVKLTGADEIGPEKPDPDSFEDF